MYKAGLTIVLPFFNITNVYAKFTRFLVYFKWDNGIEKNFPTSQAIIHIIKTPSLDIDDFIHRLLSKVL